MRVKPANLSIRDTYGLVQGQHTVVTRVVFYHAKLRGTWMWSGGDLYYFEFPSGHILCKPKTSEYFKAVMPGSGMKRLALVKARLFDVREATLWLLKRDYI